MLDPSSAWFLAALASMSLASFFAGFGLINLGDVGEEAVVSSSGASCALGRLDGMSKAQGGFYSPSIEEKDPGQGCYFSVRPGWLQNPSSARIVQA